MHVPYQEKLLLLKFLNSNYKIMDINARGPKPNQSALTLALENGHKNLVKALLEHDFDINYGGNFTKN